MFKKLLTLSIILLFALSVMGFTVSKRYCKGKLVSISISLEHSSGHDSNCCSCCVKDTEFYHIDEDFTSVQIFKLNPHLIGTEVVVFNISNIESVYGFGNKFIQCENAPSFIDRQFLFYTQHLKLAPPIC